MCSCSHDAIQVTYTYPPFLERGAEKNKKRSPALRFFSRIQVVLVLGWRMRL